jgi:serine/threonine-protein kinase
MTETAFGRYRLLSLIGEGGMGKVYKAHDTVIDRDVAIKVLPAELAAEPGYRERFRREAYTAARLSEPHIIPIHDTGEVDGQLYLVMPVVEGIDLQSLLKRDGKLAPPRAVIVIEQLAAALDAAHGVGLVHRDVKPSNALLTGRDFTYLIDFGIAHDVKATKMTRTGMIIGSFAYMAPERFTSDSADARADIYALACVLYECLTGVQPYPGDSLEQQVAGHIALEPPAPTSVDPTIPAGFDDVITRGMAKDPEERYQSAHELATAAREALATALSPYPHHARTLPDSSQPPPAPTVLTPTQPQAAVRSAQKPKVNPYDVPATQPASAPRATAPPRPPSRPPDPPPPPIAAAAPSAVSPPGRQRRRRKRSLILAGAAVMVAIIAVVAGYLFAPHRSAPQASSSQLTTGANQTAQPTPAAAPAVQSPATAAPATQQTPAASTPAQPASTSGPTVLPFPTHIDVAGVAVDSAGNVYAVPSSGPALELSAGATASVQLPLTGVVGPGVGVDGSRAVYVTSYSTSAVWKLPAGSNTPAAVTFTGMKCNQAAAPLAIPGGLAVDKSGAVYVTDLGGCPGGRVLMLPAGASTATVLPFTGLLQPAAVAVDGAGNVYVTDVNDGRVLELAAGSSRETALPFTGLRAPGGLAIDAAGDVYVSDTRNNRVLKLAAGSTTPTELSIPDMRNPRGLALDNAGNLYVADNGNGRVLKVAVG